MRLMTERLIAQMEKLAARDRRAVDRDEARKLVLDAFVSADVERRLAAAALLSDLCTLSKEERVRLLDAVRGVRSASVGAWSHAVSSTSSASTAATQSTADEHSSSNTTLADEFVNYLENALLENDVVTAMTEERRSTAAAGRLRGATQM
jgi:hypothetical protein